MSKSRDAFRNDQSWDRWNTHQTTTVEQEVFGTVLRFVQDPSSEHLGTTVWDASVVLAKWFEKNIRKGDFSRAKVRGKRAIELGAGMGLAGMAFAMVGADVVLTDTADVLGLLRINYETNLSPAAVRLARGHQHGTWADSAGSVAVAELDWTRPEQVHAPPLQPPYDFVLAADCIYHETLTEHFHRTVMDVTNEKSTVVVCNELRSHSVQGRFMELFTATHSIKTVPHSKMDDTYQHPNIFIYVMKKKKKGGIGAGKGAAGAGGGDAGEDEQEQEEEEGAVRAAAAVAGDSAAGVSAVGAGGEGGPGPSQDGPSGRLSEEVPGREALEQEQVGRRDGALTRDGDGAGTTGLWRGLQGSSTAAQQPGVGDSGPEAAAAATAEGKVMAAGVGEAGIGGGGSGSGGTGTGGGGADGTPSGTVSLAT